MHRHGYKGRKFGRKTDQRRALIKSLAESLILNESIQTTLPKAKELSSYVEKLITKAKKGDLHSRRQVIRGLATLDAAHKLVDDMAPKLNKRTSGYLRIERTELRMGDGAQMAKISFVDDLKKTEKVVKSEAAPKTAKVTKEKEPKKTPVKKPVAKKPAAKAAKESK
jgi:large subunit ribosomal protein L17